MTKIINYIFVLVALLVSATSCIEDDFTTSSSDTLKFSADTVAFDTMFTDLGSPTRQFVVYNPHKKMINISSIRVKGTDGAHFYINVDGMKGDEFHDVAIRGEDSIYVFVESKVNPTGVFEPKEFTDKIEFVTNGVTQEVTLSAWGLDAERLNATQITSDVTLGGRPYVVFDTIRVAQNATLRIEPGTTLYFHDKAALVCDGTLVAKGTQDAPIAFRGDRLDRVVGDDSYDLMSGQWGGVIFTENSRDNELEYLLMRGSSIGMVAYPNDMDRRTIHMLNCVLHNSSSSVLSLANTWVEAEGTEVTNARESVVKIVGGKSHFANCTFGNYYLFSLVSEPTIALDIEEGEFNNCIIYGLSPDLNVGDFTGKNVFFRNCLFKSKGTDDDNFLNCVWDENPEFYVVRTDYIFDFRLKNESAAIAKGDASLCPERAMVDRYGVNRRRSDGGFDIGAYTWVWAAEEDKKN